MWWVKIVVLTQVLNSTKISLVINFKIFLHQENVLWLHNIGDVQDIDLFYPGIIFLHGKRILMEWILKAQEVMILSEELHVKENNNRYLKQQNKTLLHEGKSLKIIIVAIEKQVFIQAILMSVTWLKKLNLAIEFWYSIFINIFLFLCFCFYLFTKLLEFILQ